MIIRPLPYAQLQHRTFILLDILHLLSRSIIVGVAS